MERGIRAEVAIAEASACPVAQASADADAPVEETTRSVTPTSDGRLREEFSLPADTTIDTSEATPVFTGAGRTVYRFDREPDRDCPCTVIERHGCPVADIRGRDGELFVTFYAAELSILQAVLTDLTDRFVAVRVDTLTREDGDDPARSVFVDSGSLTDRQREVLETALAMGYFEFPKRANMNEVADALGISPSTAREHLSRAQRKVLGAVLLADDGDE